MDDSFDRLEQKVKEAAARVRELKGENERLSGKAERALADLGEANARVAALEDGQKAAAESASGAEGLQAELEQARERIAELEESADAADPGGADLADAKAELKELKKELRTTREALSAAEARATELEGVQAESLEEGEVEELRQTVSRLRDERKEIKARVKKLVGALDSL